MEVTFKVAKITPSNEGKTAVLTLTVGITLFGIENAKKNVYYFGGVTAEAAKSITVGAELKEDLVNYHQVKRPYFIKDRNTWVLLTWLHSKVQYPDGVPSEPLPEAYVAWLKAQQSAAVVAA